MKLCLMVAMAVLALSCGLVIPPVDPNPPEPPQPVEACDAAGAKLTDLQCRDELGAPLWEGPTGESFAEACRRTRAWDAACITRIVSCEQYNQAATGELCQDGGAP